MGREASDIEGAAQSGGERRRGSRHLVGRRSRSNKAAVSNNGGIQFYFFDSCDLLAL